MDGRADVNGLRLALPVTSLTAGDTISGLLVRDGAASGRVVIVTLERLLLRDERVEVRRDTVAEVTLNPGKAGEAAITGLRLPEDAFTFDGTQIRVCWAVTARAVGAEVATRAALDVRPPPRGLPDCDAALRRVRLARTKRRANELLRLVVPALVVQLCVALGVAGLLMPGASLPLRLGALLPGVVAWMMIRELILPVTRRWRALARGPKPPVDAVLCGALLTMPAPSDRPCWRHVLVERSENAYRGRTSSGSAFKGERVVEKEQILAQGDGPATLTLSPSGPPTFAEAGLSIEHELRFFYPDRADDVAITLLTVAPGRVA